MPCGDFKWSWLTHATSLCVDWCPYILTRFSERVEEKLAWAAEELEIIECRLLADWLAEIIILILRTAYSLIKEMSDHWSLSCASLWNYRSHLSTKSCSHIKTVLWSCLNIWPLTATELCRRAGHPGTCKIDLSVMNPLLEGSMTTPMDAKWGDIAAYQYSQPFLSWHLLDADIGADIFTLSKARWTLNQNQPLPWQYS